MVGIDSPSRVTERLIAKHSSLLTTPSKPQKSILSFSNFKMSLLQQRRLPRHDAQDN